MKVLSAGLFQPRKARKPHLRARKRLGKSKKFKATALGIEKRALWFPKEIQLPSLCLP